MMRLLRTFAFLLLVLLCLFLVRSSSAPSPTIEWAYLRNQLDFRHLEIQEFSLVPEPYSLIPAYTLYLNLTANSLDELNQDLPGWMTDLRLTLLQMRDLQIGDIHTCELKIVSPDGSTIWLTYRYEVDIGRETWKMAQGVSAEWQPHPPKVGLLEPSNFENSTCFTDPQNGFSLRLPPGWFGDAGVTPSSAARITNYDPDTILFDHGAAQNLPPDPMMIDILSTTRTDWFESHMQEAFFGEVTEIGELYLGDRPARAFIYAESNGFAMMEIELEIEPGRYLAINIGEIDSPAFSVALQILASLELLEKGCANE